MSFCRNPFHSSEQLEEKITMGGWQARSNSTKHARQEPSWKPSWWRNYRRHHGTFPLLISFLSKRLKGTQKSPLLTDVKKPYASFASPAGAEFTGKRRKRRRRRDWGTVGAHQNRMGDVQIECRLATLVESTRCSMTLVFSAATIFKRRGSEKWWNPFQRYLLYNQPSTE